MARRKGEGHHGGAWKVAYADFVTAMMALFMVLWIIGQNKEVIQATADYFKDPIAYEHELLMGQRNISGEGAVGKDGTGLSKLSKEKLKEIAENIYQSLNLNKSAKNKPLDVFITADGIEVLIYDLPQKRIFEKDTTQLSQFGDLLFRSLAWTLDQYKGNLDVSFYDPRLTDKDYLGDLQRLLRQGKMANVGDNRWASAGDSVKNVFEVLVHHGYSLDKIQTVLTQIIQPVKAQHNVPTIQLNLHMNTETLIKR